MKRVSSVFKIVFLIAIVLLLSAWSSGLNNIIGAVIPGAKFASTGSEYVKNMEAWRGIPGMEQWSVDQARLQLPVFLLNSEDAKQANAELEAIAQKMISDAREYEFDPDDQDPLSTLMWNYFGEFSVYQDDKVLSVLVEYMNYTEFFPSEHLVYNFRLSDGKRLYDKDMAKLYGIEDVYLGMMEEAIVYEYDYWAIEGRRYEGYEAYMLLGGLTMEELWNDYDSAGSVLYLNDQGQMRFIVGAQTPAGSGEYSATLPLRGYVPFKDKAVSPAYLRMARELGIDPADESYKGLIIPLGELYDEPTAKKVAVRLFSWQAAYNRYQDPGLLLRLDESSSNSYQGVLAGHEAYLFVPRIRNASVSMSELKTNPSGNGVVVKNTYTDYQRANKAVLIAVNTKGNPPNALVTVRYRDDKYSFSPQMDPVSGKLKVPAEIIDAGQLFPLKDLTMDQVENSPYSYDFFERLFSFIPKG